MKLLFWKKHKTPVRPVLQPETLALPLTSKERLALHVETCRRRYDMLGAMNTSGLDAVHRAELGSLYKAAFVEWSNSRRALDNLLCGQPVDLSFLEGETHV